ncbi:MAG: DinB family protein [Armatimonadetes bacterium]|nr:DinB family protein [Armatimonadota bacterium]
MPHPYVWEECLEALERTPRALQRLAELIPADRWEQRPSPDLYSPRELLYHLAEVEETFYQRYRLIAEQERPHLTVYDPHDALSEERFAQGSVQEGLSLFTEARNRSLEYLRHLSEEARDRTGMHPEFGEWSIFQQVQLCVAHDLLHLGDILLRSE